MEISNIYSFLVHPGKNQEHQLEIGGVEIPLEGNLFSMFSTLFQKAPDECNIDIAFTKAEDGSQNNNCRNEVISLVQNSTLNQCRKLALRLQVVTTKRSGLGLFFVALGRNESKKRIYISRFPADFGIVAQENNQTLRVELLEQVFMKNAVSYKAAVFEGSNYNSDFWIGRAVDKQISNNSIAISGYWVREFLLSDFRTTAAQGTRRLAVAIKRTMDQTDDIEIKEELAAAARLAQSLNGKVISMTNFGEHFGLSQKTQSALASTLSDPTLRFDQFQFKRDEFSKHVKFRSIQINNGAMLTAPTGKFEDCFTKEQVTENTGEYRFSTQGRIVDEKLTKK